MTDELRYDVDDPVALITLNRPATLNALTYPMLGAMREAVDAAVRDPRVVGIVITGEGRGFCSGLDASVLQATTTAGSSLRPKSDEVPGLFTWLLQVPKPVISAVNGVAAGGGFVLTAMSDLRIASTSAAFTSIFSKRGLIAEHGMTWLVPRLIGTGAAPSLAAGQGFAALRPSGLTTRRARCDERRWRPRSNRESSSCASLGQAGARSVASDDSRRAAKLRPPQRTAGAAALIEKRPAQFPRLGE